MLRQLRTQILKDAYFPTWIPKHSGKQPFSAKNSPPLFSLIPVFFFWGGGPFFS